MKNSTHFETIEGILLLQGSINGVNGNVILDTGSQCSVINSRYFMDEVQVLSASKTATTVDENGNVTESSMCEVVISEIKVGSNTFCGIDGISINLDYVENQLKAFKENVKLLGTIGMDIISKHTISINYKDMLIAFDEKADNSAQKSPISFMSDGLIVAPVCIAGADYPFIIDTGASVCVVEDELIDFLFDSWIDEDAGLFSSSRFSVFGKEFSNIVFLKQNIGDIKKDESVYGIIGSNCMLDSTVAIDCPNKTIQIY